MANEVTLIDTKALSHYHQRTNEMIEDLVENLANADEVYIMAENETEENIPDNAVVVVFPNEDAKVIDWTNYYNKEEINAIIQKAEFKRGKSAYEIAVEQGFEGTTEKEWLDSLNGADGYTPQKGIDYFDGEDGKTPEKGVDYFDGQDGKDGEDGYTPQRGVDYWTDSDVATMKSEVKADLVGTAPTALDTLWELASALGNDPEFATTVMALIGENTTRIKEKMDKVNLSTVATSGSYNDLSDKPSIPSAYTHPSTHPASMITGLANVATSGSYSDLSGKPTIPSTLPANGGNADTVDNKHIVVSSSVPTTNDTSVITFVV